jgi:hypothetical protein
MSNPRNATPSIPPSQLFLARRLNAALAAAGLVASLGLPAPAVLAAEPVPEVYARAANLVLASAEVSVKVLNDASSIAVISPMSAAPAAGGLQVTTRGHRSASGGTTFDKAFADAATVPTNCYDIVYGPLVQVVGGLEFPPAGIEGPGVKRQVTISNSGPSAVVFGGMAKTTGDFSATSNCSGTLGVGQSCTVDLAFTPAQLGSRQGLLTIPLASPGEQISVPLIAQALPGVYGYNYPYCMEFEPTLVGQSSYPQTAYAWGYDYSESGATLELDPVLYRSPDFAITGDFCDGNPYGSSYCEVDVEFRPTQVGPLMGRMLMRSNSEYPLADVWLLGTGFAGAPGRLGRSTSLLDFGTIDLGSTSAPQSVRLTNTSTVPTEVAGVAAPPGPKALVAYGSPVTINSITVSGDYAQDNNCRTLDPGQSCTIDVTFTPTAMGDRPGVVTVESDASNSVLTVSLTGAGSTPLPAIQLSAESISFGSGVMGRPSTEQTIKVKSVGRADLVIEGMYVTGDFLQTNTCPGVLPPGAECNVTVTFLATIPGDREGKFVVLSNAAPGVKEMSLLGRGCRPFGPAGSRLADPGCS